jgi:RNA recognition motif-containing protein
LAGQQHIYKKVCINTTLKNSNNSNVGIDAAKKQSNIGYVVFHYKESVEKALLKNNMIVPVVPLSLSSDDTRMSSVTGTTETSTGRPTNVRHIRVDRCVAKPITIGNDNNPTNTNQNTTLRDPKRTIFIGNLPYHTDEETLHQHILQHMELVESTDPIIESIRIVRNPTTYVCQGFAYVLFTSIQYVPIALRMLHQTIYMKQPLRIQTCKTKTKNDHIMRHKTRNNNDTNQYPHSQTTNTNSSSAKVSTTTNNTTATATKTTTTTKAVGALKRVLQKQQRLLLQEKKSKTIRKRGPTSNKNDKRTNPKKKKGATNTNSKNKKK